MRSPYRYALAGVAAAALLTAGCSSSGSSGGSSGGTNWSAQTSAAAGGGLSALVTAAKQEGTLNVIALPADWANYGTIIKDFQAKYGIKVNSANPTGSSQDEVNAVKQENGTSAAPDVLDVGMSVALANTSLFAPYEVSTWSSIPAAQKASDGVWVQDYGGYMSVGYDSAKFPSITSVSQLLGSQFKNSVALNGNPTQANAALNGVMMTGLASGGSADSIADGVKFFHQLKQAGNFVPVQATAATIKAGTTPVVINWDYLNTASVVGSSTWKVLVPSERDPRRLLRAGHQQAGAPPGGGPAVGGVPVLPGRERRPEPVARGRRPPRRAAGDDHRQQDQHDRRRRAAAGQRHAGVPLRDPGDQRLDLSRG